MIAHSESSSDESADLTPSPAPSDLSPEERRARLRERLVHEAWTLLATEGLPALQARRVAQAAACSVGAIYNVFPDLDELILRANSRTMIQLGAAAANLGGALDPALPVGERVRRLSHVYIDFAFANELAWRSLFEYRATYRKPYPDWYREAQALVFRDLALAVLGRPVDSPEKLLLVETLWAALHGVVSVAMDARFRDVSRPTIEAQIDLLSRLLSSGVDAFMSSSAPRG